MNTKQSQPPPQRHTPEPKLLMTIDARLCAIEAKLDTLLEIVDPAALAKAFCDMPIPTTITGVPK